MAAGQNASKSPRMLVKDSFSNPISRDVYTYFMVMRNGEAKKEIPGKQKAYTSPGCGNQLGMAPSVIGGEG